MKRLLAYLFIVLSLGLTFSVSANANNSYVEGICIGNGDIYQEKYQLRLNTKKYPCKLSIVIRKSTNPLDQVTKRIEKYIETYDSPMTHDLISNIKYKHLIKSHNFNLV